MGNTEFKIRIKRIRDNALLPTYGSEYSAGADLYACLDETAVIDPGDTFMVPTGLVIEIPEGYCGLVFARSGLASKQGIAPSNKVGVIDADYRGEIMVSLFNHSKETRTVNPGDRIAQLVISPFLKADWEETEDLKETVRGSGGFGSTGK